MRYERSPQLDRYFFDSLSDVAQWIEATPREWRCEYSRTNSPSASWDLNTDFAKAWDMARYGWPEGAQKAQEALRAFTPATPSPDLRNDFYGHMPHVPRYCAGAPDNMIRHATPPRQGVGRVLTIIINITADCTQRAQSMSNFGVAVAQYVNQLETENVRCEVIAAFKEKMYRGNSAHAWRVKNADQPLDLAVLAFAVGHPAMFRRIGFALIERVQFRQDDSYGMPADIQASDILNCPIGAVVLNGMRQANTNAATPQAALAHVGEQIEKAIATRAAA